MGEGRRCARGEAGKGNGAGLVSGKRECSMNEGHEVGSGEGSERKKKHYFFLSRLKPLYRGYSK